MQCWEVSELPQIWKKITDVLSDKTAYTFTFVVCCDRLHPYLHNMQRVDIYRCINSSWKYLNISLGHSGWLRFWLLWLYFWSSLNSYEVHLNWILWYSWKGRVSESVITGHHFTDICLYAYQCCHSLNMHYYCPIGILLLRFTKFLSQQNAQIWCTL